MLGSDSVEILEKERIGTCEQEKNIGLISDCK